jgi:hypothetical protein
MLLSKTCNMLSEEEAIPRCPERFLEIEDLSEQRYLRTALLLTEVRAASRMPGIGAATQLCARTFEIRRDYFSKSTRHGIPYHVGEINISCFVRRHDLRSPHATHLHRLPY